MIVRQFNIPHVSPDPFSEAIRRNLRDDINSMIGYTGRPRRAKSWSAQSAGEQVDVNGRFKYPQNGESTSNNPFFMFICKDCRFTCYLEQQALDHARSFEGQGHDVAGYIYRPCFGHNHVAFLPQEYLNQIRTKKAGCLILFDEPGAEWSARRFMSVSSQLLNATHITFGSKLINVAWAVPVLNMQDVMAQRLLNYLFTMSARGPRGNARFYYHWVDSRIGKYGDTQIGWTHIEPPYYGRDEEMKEYAEMKKQYQDKSYEKYYKEFELSAKEKTSAADIDATVAEILKEPEKYIGQKGKVSVHIIGANFKIPYKYCFEVKRRIEQKLEERKRNQASQPNIQKKEPIDENTHVG